MGDDFELRPARPDDYEALAALAIASADTGRIRVAPRYLCNPVEAWAALKPELEWVVAESEDGLIGCGQLIPHESEIEGELRRCASLTSLMVHPAHRRRGVARALTTWRLDRAGPDTVVLAGIQEGNEGSLANARAWATQIVGALELPVFRVRRGGETPPGLELREPRDDSEWDAAAEGLAAFERGWNLRKPRSGSELRRRSALTLHGERVQRYFVALERGRVVGGLELFEGNRLQTMVFEHVPASLRALDLLLGVLPRDGELRASSLSCAWFLPAREDVARALWSFAGSIAAAAGNALSAGLDPRGPLRELVPMKPWTPKGRLALAIRSPVALSEERLLATL